MATDAEVDRRLDEHKAQIASFVLYVDRVEGRLQALDAYWAGEIESLKRGLRGSRHGLTWRDESA